MPYVRGRLIPEVSLAGRAKQFLDVLLWTGELGRRDLDSLDELECLRVYLRSLEPFACYIRIYVPETHVRTQKLLASAGIEYGLAPVQGGGPEISTVVKDADGELLQAVGTSLHVDADCLAVNRAEWLPLVEEAEKLNFFLTDCSFLLPYAEVFVRGFDVPWSFSFKAWNASWTAFYNTHERETFTPGLELLELAHRRGAPSDAQETGAVLVHNRLPNLCFTRDRLQFYEVQRLAAKREGRRRQDFSFEIAYFLNFFYVLIYGTFDHAALFVSQLLRLGLSERVVGATYKSFLNALETKSKALFDMFTDTKNTEFMERIGFLRHRAAHRGAIRPGIVVDTPDKEPTVEELDADIRAAGQEETIAFLPTAEAREKFREMLRSLARFKRYEEGKVLEGVELVKIGGKHAFIHPLLDTPWNFSRTLSFLNAVFEECSRILK